MAHTEETEVHQASGVGAVTALDGVEVDWITVLPVPGNSGS